MAVTLSRAYGGFAPGTVVDLPAELEASLVAQNLATAGGTLTSGALTPNVSGNAAIPVLAGIAVVAAGASSVTVSNPAITATSKATAMVSQAAADGTLTSVLRANCTAGVLTITGNANATAATRVSYIVFA